MADKREPLRHSPGDRNRRKIMHNAECLLEEMEFLHADMIKRLVNHQYAIHRVCTLVNRLKAEFKHK